MLDVPVFKKANQIVQRNFNCELSSLTRGGVAKQGTRMVCLYYVLYWFPSRDPANFQMKYRINWSCFPFYVQLTNDILLIKNKISNTRDVFRWNTRMDRVSINKICSMSVWQPLIQYSSMCSKYGLLQEKAGTFNTVVCRLDHSLLVRTSVTINEVYSLKYLLEFV